MLITDNLFINGPGASNVAVDGNAASSVFHIGSNSIATISGLTVTNGYVTYPGGGGGIHNDHATLSISNCVFSGNVAAVGSCGRGRGGGIYNNHGTLTVSGCTVNRNFVGSGGCGSGAGGAVFNDGLGGNATALFVTTTISNNGGEFGSAIYNSGSDGGVANVDLVHRLVIGNSGGRAIYNYGDLGLANVRLVNSTVSGHSDGAVLNDNGNLSISNSTLSANSTRTGLSRGGAIWNVARYGSMSSVEIVSSTFSDNTASYGAAIANYADFGRVRAILRIRNSTLSGNTAILGAAVDNEGSNGFDPSPTASVEILNCTLNADGPCLFNIFGEVVIGGTIVNTGGSASLSTNASSAPFPGTITSLGFNLSSDGGGGFLTHATDQINTDPRLGPLQDNGGPTLTHAITCRSPAIDAGKNFGAIATDQRGFGRTFDDPAAANAVGGDGTDIGAFEAQQPLPVYDLPPVADASATPRLIISANGTNATVILNGSRSSDPDGDALQYSWSEGGTPLATGVVAVTVLPVGTHSIQLVVSDGTLSDTNGVTIEVITVAEAVNRLAAALSSDVSRAQPLAATLRAAMASIDRSNPVSAINQLLAFQNQVRAQVAPLDPALAASLIQAAQEIINALSGGNTNPGGRPHGRFTSVTRQPNAHVRLQFSAEAGSAYLIEASTNLVDWDLVGVAAPRSDGGFEFVDAQAARFGQRFYRVRMP